MFWGHKQHGLRLWGLGRLSTLPGCSLHHPCLVPLDITFCAPQQSMDGLGVLGSRAQGWGQPQGATALQLLEDTGWPYLLGEDPPVLGDKVL